ncbi:general transcription factor 3C polypeptide 4-like [Saccostrea echinata]|uniref:general transcription factor 3C polypeptide 4-like n=1 Tax=Saccostrea echinata TaxID=191078 RepID=UPI002A827D5B|nr:general transcription factor 3C polypeptide 4-like [Saccostrea echinata]
MLRCEEKRVADVEFSDQIFCHDAVKWSEDNRVSLCTERGIIIMEMKHSPLQLDKNFHYNFSLIPIPEKSNNVTKLPIKVFVSWKESRSIFSEDEKQELFLNHPLHPYQKGQVNHGYVRAKWSPEGADTLGRCALAAVTGDHRLGIYVTGNDRKRWKEVVDLHTILFERFKDKISKNMTFNEFKEVSYNMFAVDIAWSPICNFDDVKYYILAVAMKSGVIHLIKIIPPLLSKDDVIIVSETLPLSSIPSSLCWSIGTTEENGCLVIGYQSGEVISLSIDKRKLTTDSKTIVHGDQDLIRVDCIAWKLLSQKCVLLIVSKDIHVLSFLINIKTSEVVERNSYLGQHDFTVTGLFSIDSFFVISSQDGHLQIIQPSLTEDGKTELKFSALTTDFVNIRKIFGISSSPNGMFAILPTWPLKKFDLKHMKRQPMHVFTLSVKSEEEQRKTAERLLLDETVPMKCIPDVLEYFRQSLWSGINIIPSLTSFVSQSHKWISMHVKLLRVLRYFIMTIQLHIPETTDEGIHKAALAKGTVSQLSKIILIKHVEKVFDAVLRSQQRQFTQTEIKILSALLKWQNDQEGKVPIVNSEQISHLIEIKDHQDCFICQSSLNEEELTWVCQNGHAFGNNL